MQGAVEVTAPHAIPFFTVRPDHINVRMTMLLIVALIMALSFPSPGVAGDNARPGTGDMDTITFWLDRLPAESETLLVVQESYSIPMQQDSACSENLFMELHLRGWFGEKSWQLLSGKTIDCRIEAASNFRSPDWPLEVLDTSITGWTPMYDGCHILIFNKDSAPNWNDLVTAIAQDPQTSSAAFGEVLVFEPRHHLLHRQRLGSETPELTQKIDQALTTRYWMTAYSPNVLLIATKNSILAKLSQNPPNTARAPFPKTLPQWNSIDQSFPVWGMRHARNAAIPHDPAEFIPAISDTTTGFAFSVDLNRGECHLTFQSEDAASNEQWRSSIHSHLDQSATFEFVPEQGLRTSLTADPKNDDGAHRWKRQIVFWILSMMGHPIMI